jgi:hypothetical protein
VGDRLLAIAGGHSAQVLARRSEAVRFSRADRTFVYFFELSGGDLVGLQIGDRTVATDISWDELLDNQSARIALLKVSALLANHSGAIVLLPDTPADNDLRQPSNPVSSNYVTPLDWPFLAGNLSQSLQQPTYLDGNAAVANANLDRLTLMSPANTGYVIDTESLNDTQRQYTDQIVPQLLRTGAAPLDVAVSSSIGDIPERNNIVIITAENDTDLRRRLAEAGADGKLEGKFVVLIACGDELLRNFATSGYVSEHSLAGLHVFHDPIPVEVVPLLAAEMRQVSEAEPMFPALVLQRAIQSLDAKLQASNVDLTNWLQQWGLSSEMLEDGLRRLRNGWSQLSLWPGSLS